MEKNNLISPSIDLERNELRYIFYANDQFALISDFEDLGFVDTIYEKTPYTKTIYFGSKVGLKPGLSIKVREYTLYPEENLWNREKNSLFNIIEIKSTINQGDQYFQGLIESESDFPTQNRLIEGLPGIISKDLLFRIQRISEDGILGDSTLKSKSRVKKLDFSNTTIENSLTLGEAITILCKSSDLDTYLSEKLLTVLNNKIRPLFYKNLEPYFMTQYFRRHLIPNGEDLKEIIRITVDPGVEYYSVHFSFPDNFLNDPSLKGEYLTRENFCRLEIKLDPSKIKNYPNLTKGLSGILRKYGCIAYISKKWSGVTLVSERHIEKQALWKEPLGVQISGFFPVDPTWFAYGQITEELSKIINSSSSFSSYEKEPRILVKNENFVRGTLGVPIPSLIVNVKGPLITYYLPPRGFLVKMIKDEPEFYITEENEIPVRSTLISSKEELDRVLHPSIKIEGYSFLRSYGFLVMHNVSNRVYKLTIERKTDTVNQVPSSEVYCKMRYIGNKIGLKIINKHDIYKELQTFYEEFYPAMEKTISEFAFLASKSLNMKEELPFK